MRVPVVVFIGYRGYHNRDRDGQWVDSVATFLEPTLKAWNLSYEMLETDSDVPGIARAFEEATETSLPTAVLLIGHST